MKCEGRHDEEKKRTTEALGGKNEEVETHLSMRLDAFEDLEHEEIRKKAPARRASDNVSSEECSALTAAFRDATPEDAEFQDLLYANDVDDDEEIEAELNSAWEFAESEDLHDEGEREEDGPQEPESTEPETMDSEESESEETPTYQGDPLGNAEFNYYPCLPPELRWDRHVGRVDPSQMPVIYKVGNVVIEDKRPPQSSKTAPPPLLPPRAFTKDPVLASMWEEDGDIAEQIPLPADSIPIAKNIISLLALCHGRHVLVVQLRRMQAIGPSLFNLLYSRNVKKLSFEHIEHALLLAPIGIKIQSGNEVNQLIVNATERSALSDLPDALQGMKEHHLARVLAGVDISDRDFYTEDWNNPLLCEREVACVAKEAFALYAMAETLCRANRTHFFHIDIFVQNPIPPSFLQQAQNTPLSVTHTFTLSRGRFYEDMGKLLEGLSFHLTVTVTRDVAVAQKWAEKRLQEKVRVIGFHQEWLSGKKTHITAVMTIATQNAVLVCQQLYLPSIPDELRTLIHGTFVQKCGPASSLAVFKKDQPEFRLRGFEHVSKILLKLVGKRKRRNLPKVLRDLTFHQMAKMMIGVEREFREDMSDTVRWDKPAFSEEEIEYQAVQAWNGWALMHILSLSTPDHLERLRAYLQGPEFVPKKKRIPPRIKERFQQDEKEKLATKGDSKQDALLDRLTSRTSKITHRELNALFDSFL